MAAGLLALTSVCAGKCRHTDCALTRREAARLCHFCGEIIGWDTRFCRAWLGGTITHERCLTDAAGRNDARVGFYVPP